MGSESPDITKDEIIEQDKEELRKLRRERRKLKRQLKKPENQELLAYVESKESNNQEAQHTETTPKTNSNDNNGSEQQQTSTTQNMESMADIFKDTDKELKPKRKAKRKVPDFVKVCS